MNKTLRSDVTSGGSNHTIVDRLRQYAGETPHNEAYRFLSETGEPAETLTYSQLDRRARTVANVLARHTRPGDRALLLYPSGLEFVEAFLGCLYAGVIAVPATLPGKNRFADALRGIYRDARPAVILTVSSIAARIRGQMPEEAGSDSVFLCADCLEPTGDEAPSASDIDPDSVALLQYTSGSTGFPKGVVVTHRNIAANQHAISLGLRLSRSSKVVGWLPLFHDWGLIGNILGPLYGGFPSVLMSPTAFLMRPVRWLQAISEFRGTVAASPNFGWDLCVRSVTEEEKQTLDLSCLETACIGAEPVRAETIAAFSRAFAPCGFRPESFWPCYGMAESTLFVTGGPPLRPLCVERLDSLALENHRVAPAVEGQAARQIVGCGYPCGDTQVRIVDEAGRTCPSDRVGEIWVSGDSVAQGYWSRPEESSAAFQARLEDDPSEAYLRTGDLGFLREGQLFITGRRKDLVIIRGRNLYPQDIEKTIEEEIDTLRPNSCAVFAIEREGEERLAVVMEADRAIARMIGSATPDMEIGGPSANERVDALVSRIHAAIAREHQVSVDTLVLVKPGSLPRTSSGKLQRSLCRSKMLSGELEELRQPSQ